jgi:PHD/YefM family antitoxin component YafN of YafNO toxin-antitoxin module
MSVATDLLKANRVGIRDLKEHLSGKFLKETLVITDRGTPVSVNLPYSDVLELMDILDELSDPGTIKAVQEGRKAIKAGVEGIPVSKVFDRIRSKRK